tara:strand:+ start:947 stop:1540 length:594 start_codon:yes stop_codon:yes gene_type:complete
MIKKCEYKTCCNFFTANGRRIFCSTKCNAKQRHIENYPKRKPDRVAEINKRRRERWSNMTTAEKWEYGQKGMSRINKDRQRQRQRDDFLRRYHTETEYRIAQCLRSRIGKAIKSSGGSKAHKTMRLLGCTIDYVRHYLEAQFAEGMTWDNHGGWHIDHIKPCAAFDLTNDKQQLECFNYTNLQPLWASDNMSKGSKF